MSILLEYPEHFDERFEVTISTVGHKRHVLVRIIDTTMQLDRSVREDETQRECVVKLKNELYHRYIVRNERERMVGMKPLKIDVKPILDQEAMQKLRDEFQKAANEIASVMSQQIAPAIQEMAQLMNAHIEMMREMNSTMNKAINDAQKNSEKE